VHEAKCKPQKRKKQKTAQRRFLRERISGVVSEMLHKAQTTARLTPCEDLQRSAALAQ